MKRGSVSRDFILGIVIFSLVLFIFSIGTQALNYSSPDEKRYVQSAEEMVDTGDWITPHYHGRPRFQKPILFYWLAASSMSIFGKGWFGARFPSAVCGTIAVLITYLLGRCLYDRRTGLISAALLIISWLFFIYSRLSTPDMATLFFMTLAMYMFAKLYFQGGSKTAGYIFFIALSLATLTKGFAGLLVPLITVAIFTISFKKEGIFRRINITLGLILFLLVLLPWFIMMYKAHGDIYVKHIWQVETVNRARDLWVGDGGAFLKIPKNLLRYLGLTIVLFLPSTIFLPGAVIDIFRHKGIKRKDAFLFIWIFTAIVFFSIIGTKKTHYILSLAPPLCIAIGRYVANIFDRQRIFRIFFVTFVICSLLVYLILFGYLLPTLSGDDGLLILSEKLSSLIKEDDTVGIGSHFISHNRVDSYIGINVKKVNVDLSDPEEQIAVSRELLTGFLTGKKRVFCLIIRQDFEDYIPDWLKKRVYILDMGWYWKKPNQLDLNLSLVSAILEGDREAFNRLLKNEIYLISNRP